jgi:hypothetical protein
MLVLIAINHSPFWIRIYTEEFVGYVSAAEGFVFVSAFLAGMVFAGQERRGGFPDAARHSLRRSWQIYKAQLILLASLLLLSLAFQPHLAGVADFIRPLLEHPVGAGLAAAVLLYQPTLLDILPMYVVFSLLTPVAFRVARRFGWGVVLGGGVALWVGSLFELRETLFAPFQGIPYIKPGAFDLFAWQLIWISGVWFGQRWASDAQPLRARWLDVTALLVAGLFLFLHWNWYWGEVFVTRSNWWMFDKWELGPARLLNLAALAWLVALVSPLLEKIEPRLRWFSLIGRHMLPVFCTQIAFSVLLNGVSANLRDDPPEIAIWLTLQVACAFGLALALEGRAQTHEKAPITHQ